MTYFLQTLITNGVPALFTIVVIGFATVMFKKGRKSGPEDDELFDNPNSPVATLYSDLYGDQSSSPFKQGRGGMLAKLLEGRAGGGGRRDDSELPTNVGIPRTEFLSLTHLNRQYETYAYSLTAATQSKAAAASEYRKAALRRALAKSLWDLSLPEWQELQELERDVLKQGAVLYEQWQEATRELTQTRIDHVLEDLGLDNVYQIDPTPRNSSSVTRKAKQNETATATAFKGSKHARKRAAMDTRSIESRVQRLEKQLTQLEWDFVSEVLHIAGPSRAASIRTALLGDASTRGVVPGRLVLELRERPLTVLLGANEGATTEGPTGEYVRARKPILYVCRFPGDATASQVEFLREEVTAIVRHAQQGDEALVVLQTGGGTVTGYGLAASQLVRLKSKLRLTVAVEQVAASGGYMMCCVADRIVASPFAVLGSIGVISDIPNVYERLKKEGIEFQTVTAGKYKRTLTPTKKVTKEDFDKTKSDVENVLVLFRDFVAQNRPQLDMDQVATGETWFGKDALERKLCDEIKPVDDVIGEYVDAGFDVFEVEYAPPEEKSPLSQLFLPTGLSPSSSSRLSSSSDAGGSGWLRKGVRWLARTVVAEIQSELGGLSVPIDQQVMARSDDADQVRSQS
jgi:signal peptide peptidase SppA